MPAHLSIVFVAVLSSCVQSYKILVFFPMPIRSTNILGEGIARHLLDAGHEVTYASVYPTDIAVGDTFRRIDLSGNKVLIADDPTVKISYILEEGLADDLWYHQEFGRLLAEMTFHNDTVFHFLENKSERFDAVVADFYESELYAGLAALYDCPMIWAHSMGVDWVATRLVDQPTNPAYTVDYSSNNLVPLNFAQRAQELWTQIRWSVLKSFFTMPLEENMYNAIFKPLIEERGRRAPTYRELVYDAALLLEHDCGLDGHVPALPQNVKLVGGQHIRTPVAPLPKNLQTLMDDSRQGVVYFSMGSTWQSKYIPHEIKQGILKTFGKLKQTVIWKLEEDLPNVPGNVHITKWAPQHSILAHPKCAAFVSHGGQLSSVEAVHFGVPVVGIPISFDQFRNINNAVSRGYAIKLEWSNDLPLNLQNAVNAILRDKKYSRRAKEISELYHDRPAPVGTELVYWVEHVIRTRGARHLRSPALAVPWYQKTYLDLIFIVAVSLTVTFKMLNGSKRVSHQKVD